MKRLVIIVLSLVTICFLILTAQRLTMDYNENGVYFDGVQTYDTDSMEVYLLVTIAMLITTIALQLIWKNR